MLRRCLRASLRVRYTHTLALPYNAPLAETKKAARKPATNAAPQRHSKLTTHLDRFVGALTVRRSIAECMQREQLLALLREVVTQQYGPGFEVEDINMHVFAHDNSGAMLEFVIVAPPDKSAIGLPNHYRPAEPAHLLSNRGLSDCVFTLAHVSPSATKDMLHVFRPTGATWPH
ncbi:hypothetical protein BKA62DRAFT_424543 [Auriculariales sp. MPI-PUGE-AT-0066]|nr:hypothetical protein BKA62DRAFT_424543 [Auriculariales sp. MPI-PUGE-AT-0066]